MAKKKKTNSKKKQSIITRLTYKLIGLGLIVLFITNIICLLIAMFYEKDSQSYAIFQWVGISGMLFSVCFISWGREAIKFISIPSPISRGISFLLGTTFLSTFFSLFNIKFEGVAGRIIASNITPYINKIQLPINAKHAFCAILLVLSFLFFNFASGIGMKSWCKGIKNTLITIGKIFILIGQFLKFIFAPKIFKKEVKKATKVKKEKREKVKKEPKAKIVKNKPVIKKKELSDYIKPSVSLLSRPVEAKNLMSNKELEIIAKELETTLSEFGVHGSIIKYHQGPVVTLYELEPVAGTKTARVISLADDIARSMSVSSVRIAVVTNSSTIGIEMPNKKRETVWLRSLVEDDDFNETKNALNIVLGKDIGGRNVYADLAKMPHLLVAGTTGSGKSVGINSMILSLIYKMSPDECKMIMIDPKMLELSVYNDIPHLLTPVITDPAKAVIGLKWAVKEMEDRYRNMAKLNVRNILGYNKRLEELRESGEVIKRTVQTGFDPSTGAPIYEEDIMDLSPLPYIVVVVDEMADLMLVAGKDVEAAIQRLAQMARAAGIHLIMATQRPSVDVITGTIKSNFPTRISFQVTSKIDSRTILNEMGAEQLLGMGDMLYMPAGQRPRRVHGSFVKDSEVEKIVEFVKAQKQPEYINNITEGDTNFADSGAVFDGSSMASSGGENELYQQAVQIVQMDKKASTSYIQRKLRIGYNRAASIIDRMETEGIVSQADHVGRREVL
ncbi:MAG: DNA translocase FtsK [Alphaproteobacteria bacterium]